MLALDLYTLPTFSLFLEFYKRNGAYVVVEKQTKTFQASPLPNRQNKRLIWEFIMNLWAYVVVESSKFLSREGITTAAAFHQRQWSTQRQNIVQLLMTPICVMNWCSFLDLTSVFPFISLYSQ